MDFKVHNTSSLKNKMIYDVKMFQETKCAICKNILASRRGEPCLQVIKDLGMKCLEDSLGKLEGQLWEYRGNGRCHFS